MLSSATPARAQTIAIRPRESVTHACLVGDVKALQATRYNMDTPVLEGLLPVHVAAAAGQAQVVQALAGMGADLQQVDCAMHRNTALHFAVLARKANVVKALLDEGVEVDPKNSVGTTPILDAARVGDENIMAHLWTRGADWQRPNGYGNTILHRAALYGRISLIRWLGANIPAPQRATFFAARNAAGYTAYDIAVSNAKVDMSRALEAIGADISAEASPAPQAPYSEREAWAAYQKDLAASF